VAFCQLGLQFFPDRPKALQEIRRVLMPGGRLALSVFGPIEHNPATQALANALDRHVDPAASVANSDEHELAETARLRVMLADANSHEVVIHTARKRVHFPSPAEYVRIQLAATPLASWVVQLDALGREHLTEALVKDVGAVLASYEGGAGLAFPQE